MRSSAEFSIDLSTAELLQDSSSAAAQVEIDDVSAVTPPGAAARAEPKAAPEQMASSSDEDSIEIELTAEQIDALLGVRP